MLLLLASPLDLKALIWSKYWTCTVPLLVLALIITVLTDVLLKASPFMLGVGVGTIILLTLAISALALGFGALYPQFETENAAQIPTSFGGLVFMMTTIALLALVIVIEAVPVYAYLRATYLGAPIRVNATMVGAVLLVVAVGAAATAVPLRIGVTKMLEVEF